MDMMEYTEMLDALVCIAAILLNYVEAITQNVRKPKDKTW